MNEFQAVKPREYRISILIERKPNEKPYTLVQIHDGQYLTNHGHNVKIKGDLPFKYLNNVPDGYIYLSEHAICAELEKKLFEGQTVENALNNIKDEIKAETVAACQIDSIVSYSTELTI